MKISDLILNLNTIKNQYGDFEVVIDLKNSYLEILVHDAIDIDENLKMVILG